MINKLHMAMIELYHGDAKRTQHFCKVHSYAKLIAEMENVDAKTLFILETAALTHDIGIHLCEEKYGNCNGKLQEKEGPVIAEKLLSDLGFSGAFVSHDKFYHVSFLPSLVYFEIALGEFCTSFGLSAVWPPKRLSCPHSRACPTERTYSFCSFPRRAGRTG